MKDLFSSDRLFRERWLHFAERDAGGAPLLPPLFVLEHRQRIRVVDLRPDDPPGSNVAGYVPGSTAVAPEELDSHIGDLAGQAPLVLVSLYGRRAAEAAARLESAGRTRVAALAGGIAAWRREGFDTTPTAESAPASVASRPVLEGELSEEGIRAHFGDPRSISWMTLAALDRHARSSCVDGRDERALIGTPGGDAGELLLSFAALERATGRELDEAAVRSALVTRAEKLGSVYMHTDGHALELLVRSLRDDPAVDVEDLDFETAEAWSGLLRRRPRPELLGPLQERLLEPQHVGCGHVRLILQHADDYGLRPSLVECFFRVYHELMWAGLPELGLTVLPGDHGERGVVNVRLVEDPWPLSRVPLVSPSCAGSQVFVNHPDVAAYRRRTWVELFRRGGGPFALTVQEGDRLAADIDELAERHLALTLGHLAAGLPIFEATFGRDGHFEVRAVGSVPGA